MSNAPTDKILKSIAKLSIENQQFLLEQISKNMPNPQSEEINVQDKPNFVPGIFKEGEKPSDFAGIWANDNRTLQSIREKAWKRNR
jgi:hypothetical protein